MTGPSDEALATDLAIDSFAFRAQRLRLVLAGATLLMVGLSWPLWIDLDEFPAIPFVGWYPSYPLAWSWLGLIVLILSLGLSLTERFARLGLVTSIVVFVGLILGDQLRFQPWVYQYLVIASGLALVPPRQALMFSRLYLVSVYFHSGLSKLDDSFAHEMGPLFLRTLARVLGSEVSLWVGPKSTLPILLMPMAEIVVAIALLVRRTRVLGYLAAFLIHVTLLLILGPWGLGHSPIVLVWNLVLAIEEFFLFWPLERIATEAMVWTPRSKLVGSAMGLIVVLPLVERWGIWDSWPSHALYASHCERSEITIDAQSIPGSALAFGNQVQSTRDWALSLTGWCRAVRGVPAYPQCRYANGVAEWLDAESARSLPTENVRVVHWSRAGLWTRERISLVLTGTDEIRHQGDRFWWNAHPRRSDR